MKRRIRVIQFGLGQIGVNIARTLLKHDDRFEIVGCIDEVPEKIGKDIGEILEPKSASMTSSAGREVARIYNLPVVGSIGALKRKKADVVIHSTVSFLPEAGEQVMHLLEKGYNVITTSEELFFLRHRDSKLFRKLDGLAKKKQVRLLPTGVDPGFVMDSLILMFTAPCISITNIRAERMINLSRRRLSLQRKLGIGLTSQEFLEESQSGRFGPVGLTDSAEMVADYLGMKYDNIRSTIQPILADHDFQGESVFVAKNHVLGTRQEVFVELGGQAVVSLRLTMRIDASIEFDSIFIDGDPPVKVVINNGIMGDVGSVGLVLNQIENLLNSEPGYHDMGEMKLPHFTLNHITG